MGNYYRRTGQTTLLADKIIQKLFTEPNQWVYIIDHVDTDLMHKYLLNIVLSRLTHEHRLQFKNSEKSSYYSGFLIELNLEEKWPRVKLTDKIQASE